MKNLDTRSPVNYLFLLFALLLWVLLFVLIKVSFIISLVVAVAVAFVIVLMMVRVSPSSVLRSLGANPASEKHFPRLHNAVEGICVTHGLEKPDLYVIENSNCNAAAIGDKHSQALILTTGVVDSLDLIEIEGLLAVLIAKCLDKQLHKKTVEAFFLRIPLFSFFKTGKKYKKDIADADMRASQLTRYPPGIQSALSRVSELGAEIENAPKTTSHLWLVSPTGVEIGETHPPTRERILALEDV
tara:strand:+ start:1375 stop:2103 length:729 start_codon:yes stop_codon:yes gene_type:complete